MCWRPWHMVIWRQVAVVKVKEICGNEDNEYNLRIIEKDIDVKNNII